MAIRAARSLRLGAIAANGGRYEEEDARPFVHHGCSALNGFTNSEQLYLDCTEKQAIEQTVIDCWPARFRRRFLAAYRSASQTGLRLGQQDFRSTLSRSDNISVGLRHYIVGDCRLQTGLCRSPRQGPIWPSSDVFGQVRGRDVGQPRACRVLR